MLDKKKLVQLLGNVDVEEHLGPLTAADNLAIALASYFSHHTNCPEKEKDTFCDETGWSLWVIAKTNSTLERIADAILEAIPEEKG